MAHYPDRIRDMSPEDKAKADLWRQEWLRENSKMWDYLTELLKQGDAEFERNKPVYVAFHNDNPWRNDFP
jgi:hypothetical protein